MPFFKRNNSPSSTGSTGTWKSKHTDNTTRGGLTSCDAGIAHATGRLSISKGSQAYRYCSSGSSSMRSDFSSVNSLHRSSSSGVDDDDDDPFLDKPIRRDQKAQVDTKLGQPQRVSIYANYPPASSLYGEHHEDMAGLKHRSGMRYNSGLRPGKGGRGSSPLSSSSTSGSNSPAGAAKFGQPHCQEGQSRKKADTDKGVKKLLGNLDFSYKNYYGLADAAPSATGKGGSGRARSSFSTKATVAEKKPQSSKSGHLTSW